MTSIITAISQALEDAMKILQGDLREELKAQGHYLTGRLHNSIQYKITTDTHTVKADVECEDYGLAMEFGVDPGKIPFTPGSNNGGTSQYIQGLITFFEKKGLQGREAIGAAFATARTQKREGMPTAGSYRFSRNGARKGFASTVLERDLNIIGNVLENKTGAFLQIEFAESISMEPFTIYV